MELFELGFRAAGAVQVGIAAGSLAIPGVLGWREHTRALPALTRQVFWIWAAYLWATHLSVGLLALARPDLLVSGAPLARVVCAFLAAWWGARLVLQFTVMDREARPPTWWAPYAETALVSAFVVLTAIYAAGALR